MPAHTRLSFWYVLDYIPRTAWKRLSIPHVEGVSFACVSCVANNITRLMVAHLQCEIQMLFMVKAGAYSGANLNSHFAS